jgi:hypothetical protein
MDGIPGVNGSPLPVIFEKQTTKTTKTKKKNVDLNSHPTNKQQQRHIAIKFSETSSNI